MEDKTEDIETKEIMDQGEIIERFVKSQEWRWIKDRIVEKIMDLQSVLNVDGSSAEAALADLKARITSVKILQEWIALIEGTAKQTKAHREGLKQGDTEDIIINV